MKNSLFFNTLQNHIDSLLDSLKSIDSLENPNTKDENILESFNKIKGLVQSGVNEINSNVKVLNKDINWDKLHVGFFGETNAGKSTLIEALIGGNGSSIGDGRKDYTKNIVIKKYNALNLIDMPGIEGKEKQYINKIKKAVNKSHIILYIIGSGKTPESKTLEKIKNYLNDNAEVYSITNINAKPTAYIHTKKLINQNTKLTGDRTEKKFKSILGSNYSGNIFIQAYLGFLYGNKVQKEFLADQQKSTNIFGDKKKFYNFSNLHAIKRLLDKLHSNSEVSVKVSISYKFLNTLSETLGSLLREKKQFDLFIKTSNDQIEQYFADMDKIIENSQTELESLLKVRLNKFGVELKRTLSESIDEENTESTIKNKLSKLEKRFKSKIEREFEELIHEMEEKITIRVSEFKERISLKMKVNTYSSNININEILESLAINLKYMISKIIDVGISIVGIVIAFSFNVVVGVVTLVVAAIRQMYKFFQDKEKRKRKAKKEAINKAKTSLREAKKKVRAELKKELKNLNWKIKKPIKQFKLLLIRIKNISFSIDAMIKDIIICQKEISLLLLKDYFNGEVEFAYLDLALDRAVVIGLNINESNNRYINRELRLGKVDFFTSHKEWLKNSGSYKNGNTYIASDEFTRRAVNALLIDNLKSLDFQKVVRR